MLAPSRGPRRAPGAPPRVGAGGGKQMRYRREDYNEAVFCVLCNIRGFYWLRELYEAHFHKPAIYGSGQVWAKAWDVFCRTPSRGGRGRLAAVDIVVWFWCGGILCFFSFSFSLNAHGLLQVRDCLASLTSLLVTCPQPRWQECVIKRRFFSPMIPRT